MRPLLPSAPVLLALALGGCKLFVDPAIPETCEDVGGCGDGDGGGDGGDDTAPAGDLDGDGHTVADGDCDDTDAAVHPGAAEVCDDADVDEDCNGLADDADPGVTGTTTWYTDSDGDGWGDGPASSGCERPAGAALEAGDCDDADAQVSPGATEICGNGVDDDCDGGAGSCVPWNGLLARSVPPRAVVNNAASAWFGVWTSSADLDDDGLSDLIVSNPVGGPSDNGIVGAYAGLRRGETRSALSGTLFTYLGTSGANMGVGVLGAPDLTGDGADDLVVLGYSTTALLFDGPLAGSVRDSDAFVTFTDFGGPGFEGEGLAAADVTGDGHADLIMGDVDTTVTGTDTAGVLVVHGGPVPRGTARFARDADARLWGTTEQRPGTAATTADLDGDGLLDVITGGPEAKEGTVQGGLVWILRDGVPTDGVVADVADRVVGRLDGGSLGHDLAAGDLDGDGHDDLVVAQPFVYGGGIARVQVFTSPVSGDVPDSAADLTLADADGGSVFGYSVEVGDLSGDGRADLVVAQPTWGPGGSATYRGAAWIWYDLPPDGSQTSDTAGAVITGDAAGDGYGYAVEVTGDVDGDGVSELAVGGEALTQVDLLFGGGL